MKFISGTKEYCTREKHINAPILRKEFNINDLNKEYTLKVACCGFYRVYLNGVDITKGFLAPYISNPNHYVYYDLYQIKEYLKENNVLCFLLGNGFNNSMDCGIWGFESASFRSAPKVACEIYDNNQNILLETDESFEVYPSWITYDDLRAGERVDARLIDNQVFLEGYQASYTNAVVALKPLGELVEAKIEPVVTFNKVKALNIIETKDGIVFDFGRTDAGIYTFNINTTSGRVIDLYFGEVFSRGEFLQKSMMIIGQSDPEYTQHDQYITKDGYQEYTPTFTYHGFRYVLVKGITKEEANIDMLEFIPVHSQLTQRSNIKTDNENINKLQEMVINSDISNIIYLPMDCPQREKNGWTGDTNLSAEQFLYNLDCSNTLREWLLNCFKAQNEKGAMPGIVPTDNWGFEWGNGPAWDGVIVELTYRLYQFNNDLEIIKLGMPHIKKYFNYQKEYKLNQDNLLKFGLGDWMEAGSFSDGGFHTDNEITDTLVTIDLLNKSIQLCKVINEDYNDLVSYKDLLTKAFKKKYVKDGLISSNTQTAQALALHVGLFEGVETLQARQILIDQIREESNHFKVGVIGSRYLYEELANALSMELAMEIMFKDTFPSFKYWIDHGLKTLPEAFNLWKEEKGVVERVDTGRILSFNHHFWGSISGWFHKVLVGVNVVNFETLEITPGFTKEINTLNYNFELHNNKINIEYIRKNNNIEYTIWNKGFKLNVDFTKYNEIKDVQVLKCPDNIKYIVELK